MTSCHTGGGDGGPNWSGLLASRSAGHFLNRQVFLVSWPAFHLDFVAVVAPGADSLNHPLAWSYYSFGLWVSAECAGHVA